MLSKFSFIQSGDAPAIPVLTSIAYFSQQTDGGNESKKIRAKEHEVDQLLSYTYSHIPNI
jgi:hypothetical protein